MISGTALQLESLFSDILGTHATLQCYETFHSNAAQQLCSYYVVSWIVYFAQKATSAPFFVVLFINCTDMHVFITTATRNGAMIVLSSGFV